MVEPFSPRVTMTASDCCEDARRLEPRLLPDEFVLVVVADQHVRAHDAGAQFVGGRSRALLAGIVDVLDPERAAFLRVLHHGRRIVGRDDRQVARAGLLERELRGVRHRARVERGDLVVVAVAAAEERRAELARDLADERRVDAVLLEPLAVLREVLAGRRHQHRPLAQQGQRVGDVGRTPAPSPVHRIDQEAQADPRQVVGQDVLGEGARERHQVVVGNRTGDDDAHGSGVDVSSMTCGEWAAGAAQRTYLPMMGARSRLTCSGIASACVMIDAERADAQSFG